MYKSIKEWDIYISDGNYSSKYPRSEEFVDEGIPFIRGNNMIDGEIVDEDMYHITEEKHGILLKGHVQPGDVLITTRGNIGQVAIVPERHNDSNINAQIVLLRVNKEELYNRYLLWALQSHKAKEQYLSLQTGTALKQLPVGKLEQVKIKCVDLKSQFQIAEILDKAYQIIKSRKNELIALDDLIKARFVELFGDAVANPMHWPVKKLKDLSVQINSGNTPKGGSENYVEEGITFFRSQNVWKDRLEMDDIAYIDAETHASMKRSSLKHGDILMTKTGRINTENSSLGRAALYMGEDDMANVNGHVYFIRLKPEVNNKFVLRILVSPEYRDLIRSVCVGGIDKRQLNKEHIEDFPIICPPTDIVDRFIDFVEQVDKSKVMEIKKNCELINNSFYYKYI